jgi:hypothetical protein
VLGIGNLSSRRANECISATPSSPTRQSRDRQRRAGVYGPALRGSLRALRHHRPSGGAGSRGRTRGSHAARPVLETTRKATVDPRRERQPTRRIRSTKAVWRRLTSDVTTMTARSKLPDRRTNVLKEPRTELTSEPVARLGRLARSSLVSRPLIVLES